MKRMVALITGASSGIGKELAKVHAAHGGDVVVVARREAQLLALKQELEQQYGVSVTVMVKDLGKAESAQEIYEECRAKHIEVDYLINNAGFGGLGHFHERELDKDMQMIQVNIVALTALTRLFLPDFVKRGSGRVMNVSSTASLLPGPMQAVYFASKAYVTSFSNAIAQELKGTGVSVTAVLPGATQSEFGDVSGMSKTMLFAAPVSARKVAEESYDAMRKGKLNILAGLHPAQRVVMSMSKIAPKRFLLPMVYKLQKERK